MFRVEFFCDDRKVGDALRSLLGLAIGIPTATPVINAEPSSSGKIHAKTDGKLVNLFASHVANLKGDMIISKDIGNWLTSIGMSSASMSYVSKQAMNLGIIKRTGTGKYRIIRALPKPARKGANAHG